MIVRHKSRTVAFDLSRHEREDVCAVSYFLVIASSSCESFLTQRLDQAKLSWLSKLQACAAVTCTATAHRGALPPLASGAVRSRSLPGMSPAAWWLPWEPVWRRRRHELGSA